MRTGYPGSLSTTTMFAIAALGCSLMLASVVQAAEGVVVHSRAGCKGRLIVQSATGFVILELFSGIEPNEGDRLSGDLNSYGIKDLQNMSRGTNVRVWVDDFGMSRTRATEKIAAFCE